MAKGTSRFLLTVSTKVGIHLCWSYFCVILGVLAIRFRCDGVIAKENPSNLRQVRDYAVGVTNWIAVSTLLRVALANRQKISRLPTFDLILPCLNSTSQLIPHIHHSVTKNAL